MERKTDEEYLTLARSLQSGIELMKLLLKYYKEDKPHKEVVEEIEKLIEEYYENIPL